MLTTEIPVFRSFAVLAIPTIGMQPSLDEIQQYLNKSVQAIVNVSKNLTQWTKGRKLHKKQKPTDSTKASLDATGAGEESLLAGAGGGVTADDTQMTAQLERAMSPTNSVSNQRTTTTQQKTTYFKAVSENKDVAKMVSVLFTCLSSTKQDVMKALDRFKEYQFIWQKDRDDELKEFVKASPAPKVGEYEARIRDFESLINEINAYAEYIPVGAIALVTEKLKLGLTSEIALWKTSYGLSCNQKYKKEINEILTFVEDIMKRLQREIKDLDDIRYFIISFISFILVNYKFK